VASTGDDMNDYEKLLWMFEKVHGEMTGSCSVKCNEDEYGVPVSVSCMKDGEACWTATKVDLLFDFVTRDL
jgi:hypothetical protein